jgi:hypothetical protein
LLRYQPKVQTTTAFMKAKHHPTYIARFLCLCLALPAIAGLADEALSIDWYTVDGGGGATSAGEFTISGTVGQPDAGMLIPYCNCFSILGGYWSQFTDVDQPDGPRLCIRLTSTNTFLLSWRAYHVGYALEKMPTGAPSWNDVPATPVVVQGDNQVSIDDLAGWVTTVCTNPPGSDVLITNPPIHMTGFEWYRYLESLGGNPPANCWVPLYSVTNQPPTLFRLRKP